jgi:adenylate cyclase, class 2
MSPTSCQLLHSAILRCKDRPNICKDKSFLFYFKKNNFRRFVGLQNSLIFTKNILYYMTHLNVEIKAKSADNARIKAILEQKNARFEGIDHQIDTYFKVPNGRLKLREGNIENALIFYNRPNQAGPKQSDILLYQSKPQSSLKAILTQANGILKVVDKHRHIYFIDNVKFHLDDVNGLGSFVEIEAIDSDGSIGYDTLLEQCQYYIQLFGIQDSDLLTGSYSDYV